MSSNFACEAVQRSAGVAPRYLYAPAPEGLAEQVGGITIVPGVVVANNAAVNLLQYFPAGSNGIYFLDCAASNAQYSITTMGVVAELVNPGLQVTGFNSSTIANVAGQLEVFVLGTGAGPVITQNSGGPLTYTITIVKLGTVQRY